MIEINQTGDLAVVRPRFDVVASRVGELRDTILGLASKGVQTVVLDLSQATVIDSMGIGVVVACLKTLKARGGDLRVATDNQDFVRLFGVLKLDFILTSPV
jgi:anti-sigma B factor antagonist